MKRSKLEKGACQRRLLIKKKRTTISNESKDLALGSQFDYRPLGKGGWDTAPPGAPTNTVAMFSRTEGLS